MPPSGDREPIFPLTHPVNDGIGSFGKIGIALAPVFSMLPEHPVRTAAGFIARRGTEAAGRVAGAIVKRVRRG